MKSKIIVSVFWFALLGAMGCSQEPVDAEFTPGGILKDKSEYATILKSRTDPAKAKSDPFDITRLQKDGENIEVTVRGGCSVANYKVVWDGLIRESFPMQINLALVLNSGGTCASDMSHVVRINLPDVLSDRYGTGDYVVSVYNASQVQDMNIDQNGISTNLNN